MNQPSEAAPLLHRPVSDFSETGRHEGTEIQDASFQWIGNPAVGFCRSDHESYVKHP
ncbi:hypothetical protein SynBIOSU31_01770 [Synechococcus sp. BIOS-U3-1]|nr:hypothetical protein SynBIOSU31_01770 [Synechococcus sp. BIOS-U3-1]